MKQSHLVKNKFLCALSVELMSTYSSSSAGVTAIG